MIDTNALLSFGFSIVAAFTNVVEIPNGAVPTRVEDLRKYLVRGPPVAPSFYLHLADRRGTEFGVEHGAVVSFWSTGSYRRSSSPSLTPRLKGVQALGSNQVVELATKVVRRLAKAGDPILSARPSVRRAGDPDDEMPFYWITWPKTNSSGRRDYSAFVEVDARSGFVTYLEMLDQAFFNL